MYLVTCIRPDLTFCHSYFPRGCSYPLESHYTAVKRLLRYLAGTYSMSLRYKRTGPSMPLSIVAFSDAIYNSCRDTRSSVSGYAFMWNGFAISLLWKEQQSIASYTLETEYMTLATTSCPAV